MFIIPFLIGSGMYIYLTYPNELEYGFLRAGLAALSMLVMVIISIGPSNQILAEENVHTGLRANCINPGPVRTNMRLQAYPAEDKDKLATPENITAAYIYLLGPDSKGVTGKSFDIN